QFAVVKLCWGANVISPSEASSPSSRNELVRALTITLGNESLAAEAVDEALTRALHRWSLVGSFDEPRAWVYRTARNHATSRFRRLGRDRRFAPRVATPDAAIDSLPDPELSAALDRLSVDQRNVLVLRYFLDWPIAAISDALDISPGTVKSRTSRALQELNRHLGGSR
ncbi:MAG: RNA polymerase sigma factor, partial [Acidimicrobiales bacterium]